jgi:hypothetical protein
LAIQQTTGGIGVVLFSMSCQSGLMKMQDPKDNSKLTRNSIACIELILFLHNSATQYIVKLYWTASAVVLFSMGHQTSSKEKEDPIVASKWFWHIKRVIS